MGRVDHEGHEHYDIVVSGCQAERLRQKAKHRQSSAEALVQEAVEQFIASMDTPETD